MALDLVNSCGDGACQTDESQEACFSAAIEFFNWCVGTAEPSTAPELPKDMGPVVFGADYPLGVTTRNPAVTGVSFWLIQIDITLDKNEPKALKIGDATLTASGFGVQVWRLSGDTLTWPIGDDSKMVLMALSEIDGTPVGVSHVTLDVTFDPNDVNHDGAIDKQDLLDAIKSGLNPQRIQAIRDAIGR